MKNVRTFEGWKNDRAEMEMRKSGEEMMKKAAERKAEENKGCDCENCDCKNCDEENCDCDCCCKPIGESVASEYLDNIYEIGGISSDVYDITKEEEDLDSITGSDVEIKKKVLDLLNSSGGISSDVYQMEMENL